MRPSPFFSSTSERFAADEGRLALGPGAYEVRSQWPMGAGDAAAGVQRRASTSHGGRRSGSGDGGSGGGGGGGGGGQQRRSAATQGGGFNSTAARFNRSKPMHSTPGPGQYMPRMPRSTPVLQVAVPVPGMPFLHRNGRMSFLSTSARLGGDSRGGNVPRKVGPGSYDTTGSMVKRSHNITFNAQQSGAGPAKGRRAGLRSGARR